MTLLNKRLWRKSYMLEFLVGETVDDVFTFSVPPESEDFSFPQRVTETKTFGGSVFDQYGNDSIHITLTGTTINEEKKYIYRGSKKQPMYLSGEKEIYTLQKKLAKWNAETVEEKDERRVYLYDLSKMSLLQRFTGVAADTVKTMEGVQGNTSLTAESATRNYWRVFIKELKIKRDKSRPMTYSYTLDMTGCLTRSGPERDSADGRTRWLRRSPAYSRRSARYRAGLTRARGRYRRLRIWSQPRRTHTRSSWS